MITSCNPWKVVQDTWNPEENRFMESLTSISNGYMGMRGNFEEDYSGQTHQGTYLGGVWFPDKTRVGWWKNGYPPYFGKMINAPNLMGVRVKINGEKLDIAQNRVLSFHREVDMKQGVYRRSTMVEMPDGGRVLIESCRFVSVRRREVMAMRYCVTPSFPCTVELESCLTGDVRNLDANYDERFWDQLNGWADDAGGGILVKTKENPFGTPRFAVAASQVICPEGGARDGHASEPGFCMNRVTAHSPSGGVCVYKYVGLVTSRDVQEEELEKRADAIAQEAARTGFEELLREQVNAWEQRWETMDVTIEGDDEAQQGIRFNLFQLLSTYSGEDARLNIGPKGFTGEKYGGATYWDTEAYCLPVYMSVAGENVARQLLIYRRRQLKEAYENARAKGLKGALFPMVTFTGRECHNEWEITFEEIHRNGAVAHAVFDYTQYSGDETYRTGEGLDVLYGIAAFYADRAHFSKRAGKYMIHGVTGPNEYENNVNNNWYTNRIAAWSISYFLESLALAGADRERELGITENEKAKMRAVAEGMYEPKDEELGIFVQHDTFLDKDLQPASAIAPEDRPINQHWSWDRILRSCYIKQADVLQGLYFLEHLYSLEEIRRNFDFYEPMTVHESSLSPCVHAILAARLGYRDKAVEMYRRTARLDLDNINHDTDDGLHITSMSGSWLAITKGFAGMRTIGTLSFRPFLPSCWKGYAFAFTYRNRVIHLKVRDGKLTLTLKSGEPISVSIYDRTCQLEKEITMDLKA